MKYKVGEKVRVREDLEPGKYYGEYNFIGAMKKFRGKTVEIDQISRGKIQDCYHIKEDEYGYFWTDEMFEPVITNFDKVKEEMKIVDLEDERDILCISIHRVRKEDNCCKRNCKECREWLKQPYEEHKKEILDKQERRYLSSVIKPFRNKVKYIKKSLDVGGCFISIELDDDDGASLPYFEGDTMYKGMEVEKEYTLEELGL